MLISLFSKKKQKETKKNFEILDFPPNNTYYYTI